MLVFMLFICLQQIVGVWAPEVRDATAVAVNHKYKLMAFGRKWSE
jgi:hypothetical protein